MRLRPEYESICAAILRHSPLPSLDVAIQEFFCEEKRLGLVSSLSSDVALVTTHPCTLIESLFNLTIG